MDKCLEKVRSLVGERRLAVDLVGLGHFRNEVLFAKIADEDTVKQLQEIADIVEETFLEHDMTAGDGKAFKPHATIAKLSKMKGNKKKRTYK